MTETVENTTSDGSSNVSLAQSSAPAEPTLEIFKDVPNYDPRTLVLKYGDKLLDLGFCSCPNKYKKRFSALIAEYPELINDVKTKAVALAEQGYKEFDVKEILDSLRTEAKIATPAAEYFAKHPHDFNLEVLYRNYLTRKLMMEEAKLFGFFTSAPVKCRSNCGYPSEVEPQVEESTSIAGF